MEITSTEHRRCTVIKADGRVDSYTAPQLEEVFKAVTDHGVYKIVFDMTDVNFMSSKGWWVLIETQKVCKRYNRGELVLSTVDERIRGSLDLVGMSTYFQIFDDVTDAVGSF